jgi:hypothetical protein
MSVFCYQTSRCAVSNGCTSNYIRVFNSSRCLVRSLPHSRIRVRCRTEYPTSSLFLSSFLLNPNSEKLICLLDCHETDASHMQVVAHAAAAQEENVLSKLGRVLKAKAANDLQRLFSGSSKSRERLSVGQSSSGFSLFVTTIRTVSSLVTDKKQCEYIIL